jgi:Excalibur calcium-binding domain
LFLVAVAFAVVLATPGTAAINQGAIPTADLLVPLRYKNCTNLNKRYPHGLGKRLARDKTSGTPVRNFFRSTRLYNIAMSYNRGLDRDKDGIACEKR